MRAMLDARLLVIVVACGLAPPLPRASEHTIAPLGTTVHSSFRDGRDGKRYRTLRFERIEWMRDNLAFEAEPSWCYEDSTELCEVYGRLYQFSEAMRACPTAWRLPTDEEWMQIEMWAGLPRELLAQTRNRGRNREGAALAVFGGTGFDALLAGYRNQDGSYTCKGRCAAFWSSSETPDGLVWHRDLDNGGNHRSSMWRSLVDKDYALSVRCVRQATRR
jgi:uncharacterized protein (TIGR02145 family)